jgi:hypothetical protein
MEGLPALAAIGQASCGDRALLAPPLLMVNGHTVLLGLISFLPNRGLAGKTP